MKSRLDYQLDLAQRAVRRLQSIHVQVHRVILDVKSPSPTIETGPGPFTWVCNAFGHDEQGAYWHYQARYNGVDLHRQVRDGGSNHGR